MAEENKTVKKSAAEEKIVAKPLVRNEFETVKFVLMTEKSVRAVEAQNKLVFIVKRNAKRDEIKHAVEKMFEAPVGDVKTVIDQAGRKKAFVKFKNAGAAGDIAIKLGII
jgi:large subunit ribosomal protein L23